MGLQRLWHSAAFHSYSKDSLLFEPSQKLSLHHSHYIILHDLHHGLHHYSLSLCLSFYLKIPYMGGQSSQGHFNQHSSSTWETIQLTQIIKVVAVVFDTNNKILWHAAVRTPVLSSLSQLCLKGWKDAGGKWRFSREGRFIWGPTVCQAHLKLRPYCYWLVWYSCCNMFPFSLKA